MTVAGRRTIVIAGGDGVGPEVTAEGRRILARIIDKRALPFELVDVEYGASAYNRHGKVLTEAAFAAMRDADAILFGATGGPEFDAIPAAARKAGNLLAVRRELDLFANLRPIKPVPELHETSSLKARVIDGVDLVIVRELVGGIYFGQPRGIEVLANGERLGTNTHQYTSTQIRKVTRAAFDLARTRNSRVCSVAKENVMEAGRLWREEVQAVRDSEYPDIELNHMLADNCAMQLVRAPKQFDVILTDNLFGDILSDCAAMVTGSLGMLPSASLGPLREDGRRAALYEPVHGSAPDIAGQSIANPLGSIYSVAMLLRFSLGRRHDADLLEQAIANALAAGARTRDIAMGGESLSTTDMGAAVLSELERLLD
ncbi:3-isopropylmalate dehydrogenase [Peristeroidobacter soli]|uniref:3-isopropylmalate dehydrogenase n=1 Tax=Peristeroidobacter soli TaxID=2497877 RepID=UPI00101C97EE|nr:3-isopropylmalate dehydrogenase [Peristeroidobacter soli]